MNSDVRVDGRGPLMGKDMNLVCGLVLEKEKLRNELLRAPVVHVFLSNNGDFHYRDEIRPVIWQKKTLLLHKQQG